MGIPEGNSGLGPYRRREYPVAPFNPSSHTVEEVVSYLNGPDVTETERARVVALEKADKDRVTLLRRLNVEDDDDDDNDDGTGNGETSENSGDTPD